ncbi:hypothetical protein BJF79_11645 [Actinomadura sp. CNU-125]|nr:hypothetical protein BJF79_11645 [Actinomadura sp. CNU-125]
MSFPPNVDRYRIDRALGSGAFASVWLGHDDALESQVAIKVLSGSLIDDLDVRNRFLEEARILRRADSERLVRVHDIGELPDRRPYFVMSYADRGTLADRMRERPLPVNEAIALAEEIAYGVEVINALGVIHRDLKPSNVLFQSTADGGEKLLIADLGLAKALAHASGAFTLPVGTPGYMSPEQARFGGGLDVRADVYGLGALTYHMLAGRAPGPAPVKAPPSELREGVTAAMDQVVLRALEVDRENRWPTAEDFAEALSTLIPSSERIAAASPQAPAPAPEPAPAPAPAQKPPPQATMIDEAPSAAAARRPRRPSIRTRPSRTSGATRCPRPLRPGPSRRPCRRACRRGSTRRRPRRQGPGPPVAAEATRRSSTTRVRVRRRSRRRSRPRPPTAPRSRCRRPRRSRRPGRAPTTSSTPPSRRGSRPGPSRPARCSRIRGRGRRRPGSSRPRPSRADGRRARGKARARAAGSRASAASTGRR